MEHVYHTLEPIYDKESRTLILGSMPSIVSRDKYKYYANKTNRFWNIMERLYSESVDDYKEFILRNHLALWDVIESCDIASSQDATIKNVKVNDISSIINKSKIENIFLLGRKAYDLYYKYVFDSVGIEGVYLPSTSSANARMSFEDLLERFKIIKEVTK